MELRYDQKQIEFLDTLVKSENGHIYTDLYVKPTDKQLYLTSSSCHPSSTKKDLHTDLGYVSEESVRMNPTTSDTGND